MTDIRDRKNYEKLFHEFYAPLCAFAQNYIADRSATEDLVQEVFVNLWNQHENLENIQSVKAFLYTSVRNKCLNYLKHLKVKDKYAKVAENDMESEVFFFDHVIEEETHRLIYNAIRELPPKCRDILLLSINGLKNHEIAEELHISLNTVKTQKSIAYRQLRIKLKELMMFSPFVFMHFLK